VKTLELVIFLFGLVAWLVAAYEQALFNRAWRRETGEYASILLTMLRSDLPEECRLHRRRVGWALAAFFGFFALGAINHFMLHGRTP
jgi:hypothetical protein